MPFGETLRAAREGARMSVAQVAEELKTRPECIQGLEAGDLSSFPAPVYARVFLRSYATLVGLDPKPLLADLDHSEDEGPRERGAPVRRAPKRAPRRDKPIGPIPLDLDAVVNPKGFLWPAAIGLVVIVAAVLWGMRGERDGAAPTVERGTALAPVGAGSPGVPASIAVSVEATERTWIEYSVDDGAPVGATLEPGQTQGFGAKTRLVLRLGNAGGVKISCNNKPLGAPGKPNQVRHLVFERENNEDRVYRVVNGERHLWTPNSP